MGYSDQLQALNLKYFHIVGRKIGRSGSVSISDHMKKLVVEEIYLDLLLQRLKYFRVQAAEPERKTVYISITEKLREICPHKILNIFLCNLPAFSPV